MTQTEFDFSDSEPTREYGQGKRFEFVGTTSVVIDLDPSDYEGLSVAEVTDELVDLLRDYMPGVDFNEHDIVLAANELVQ